MSLIWVQVTIKARKEKEMTKGEKEIETVQTSKRGGKVGACHGWEQDREINTKQERKTFYLIWKGAEKLLRKWQMEIRFVFQAYFCRC